MNVNSSGPNDDKNDTEEILVHRYLGMVRHIAGRLAPKAPQGLSVDDLVGAGMVGLADAARRFDPEKASQFKAYARTRIQGAIIDEIRSNGPLSRNTSERSHQLTAAIRTLQHRLSRQPSEEEIAKEMEISVKKYRELLVKLQKTVVLSPLVIQKATAGNVGYPEREYGNPQDAFLFAELKGRLAEAISDLSEKEQRVLSMYYKDEIPLKQIGKLFGVSESRACQIRAEAVHRLRAILEEGQNG